jgi:hypothetical protein
VFRYLETAKLKNQDRKTAGKNLIAYFQFLKGGNYTDTPQASLPASASMRRSQRTHTRKQLYD